MHPKAVRETNQTFVITQHPQGVSGVLPYLPIGTKIKAYKEVAFEGYTLVLFRCDENETVIPFIEQCPIWDGTDDEWFALDLQYIEPIGTVH